MNIEKIFTEAIDIFLNMWYTRNMINKDLYTISEIKAKKLRCPKAEQRKFRIFLVAEYALLRYY